jgi:lipopolysaccharide export system protein LptA
MKGPKTEKKEPIHVNSDRMEAYNKKNMIVFIGNVLAVQGEMQIQSDRLEVYVKKKEKTAGGKKSPASSRSQKTSAVAQPGAPGQGSVERLIAIGNVLVNQGKEKYASGDRLDYREATGIAVLTGNPRAWENNNQVIGTKIVLFLRDGRTVVYGSRRRRVSVTLYPESQSGKPANLPKKGSNGR